MNTKQKGRRGDFKAVNLLESYGYYFSIISAASLGTFDTCNWNNKTIVFVQNKTNRMPPNDECLKMMQTPTPVCSLRFLFIWHDRQSKPEAWLIEDDKMTPLTSEKLGDILQKGFYAV